MIEPEPECDTKIEGIEQSERKLLDSAKNSQRYIIEEEEKDEVNIDDIDIELQ